jgi:hypothetical protein
MSGTKRAPEFGPPGAQGVRVCHENVSNERILKARSSSEFLRVIEDRSLVLIVVNELFDRFPQDVPSKFVKCE